MNRLEERLSEAQQTRRRRRGRAVSIATLILFAAISTYLIVTYIRWTEVVIAPADAVATAQINVVEGRAVVLGKNVIAIKGLMKFTVSAAGYQSESLSVTDSTWRRKKINVVLKPLPAKLTAKTIPVQPDINWYLNDTLIAAAEVLSIELNPGTYSLSARHPHFEASDKVLSLGRDESRQVTLNLEPLRGRLEVTSTPSGANVTLNSQSVGETPLQLEVEGGEYDMAVSLQHHRTHTDRVVIKADSPLVSRHYALDKATRKVRFSLLPDDGLLTVNSIAISTRPAAISLPVNSRHVAEYVKPGFQTQAVEFTVRPDSDNQIDLELLPIFGLVEVVSEPIGEVSVNGKVIGKTPIKRQLQAVPQTIAVSREGYLPQSFTITPNAGITEVVSVKLVTEQAHRLATSPEEYENSIGMAFKLFKQPDSFSMGSLPGEANSRVNEFNRRVQLKRPFYAGVHEVTVEQYAQFKIPDAALPSQLPVTEISWTDAARFCNWMSDREGYRPVYRFSGTEVVGSDVTADGYRMLTEAEWEWLVRKAGRTQQVVYSWGNESSIPINSGNLADESAKGIIAPYIQQYDDGYPRLSPVGTYPPNAAGIHDLTGNVSEWTHDSYSHVQPPAEVEIDPFETSPGNFHTIKGSNWRSAGLSEIRAAFRRGASSGDDTTGFRVARYLY